MTRISCVGVLALGMLLVSSLTADEPAAAVPEVAWGKIVPGAAGTGLIMLDITNWPADGKLKLPTPFANITCAYLAEDRNRQLLSVEYNADATTIVLHLPKMKPEDLASKVVLETAEKSEQFAHGRMVLTILDARISAAGEQEPLAKRVSHPGHHRIDFGQTEEEAAIWEYVATRPGMYDVEVTYANDDAAEAQVEFHIGESKVTAPRVKTNGSSTYTTSKLGPIYVSAAGKTTAACYCKASSGGPAAISLKAITLRPACEGQIPQQAEDGSITCHARDVTIQGVKVQYEPKPEKNTVGYWVNESDWVYWDFTNTQPGKYQVEILQGCGTGHGGSEVNLSLAGQKLPFTVEDTGHFQNFKPRTIGTVELKAGPQRLSVVPVKKAKAAVMDLRQVRLIPVKGEEGK